MPGRRGKLDLILGIHLGSGGWDPTRVLGRRRSPAGGSVRGAGDGRSSAPGLGLAWDLVQELEHGLGDPLVGSEG